LSDVEKSAAEILKAAAQVKLADENEASTRLKIIDRVIKEILGWQHSDLSVESHVTEDGKTEYADYILTSAMTSIVIEAKRVGKEFADIPFSQRTQKISAITRSAAGEAIIQARDYARKLSVPFAVVTNGNQWIVFAANRVDRVPFEKSNAIIFDSLNVALETNLEEFRNLLSRTSVISGSLESALTGSVENQPARQRLNDHFKSHFSRVKRENIYHLIDDEISTAFSEEIIFTSADLLEKVYVQTPDRIRYDDRINMHIKKRNRPIVREGGHAIRAHEGQKVSEKIASAAERTKPLAVLILGSVGSGKTTFLQHTRYVKNKDFFAKSKSSPYPHWIYVDYKEFSPEEDPAAFLRDRLFDYIKSDDFLSDHDRCIRHAYKDEITSLIKGPLSLLKGNEQEVNRNISEFLVKEFSNRDGYVEKILKYAALNAPVFLVIDNIDQFPKDDVQKRIFQDATATAYRMRLNLFISLRDATYIGNRSQPLFDAFDFDPIHVEPPKIDSVLSKRFFVARQLMDGKKATFTAENGALFKLENKAIICELIQSSVLGTEVGTLIEVMATSDVRLALRVTREFLQYGYTATQKAVEVYKQKGRYRLPPHEALRAIMLGNSSVYADEFSVVGNPLDAKISKSECQLLRLYLMTALVNMASNPRFQSCNSREIHKHVRNIGFGDDITSRVLSDLCNYRYLLTTSHTEPDLDSEFIPSRMAGYVVRDLLANFAFLENLMSDTFIPDTAVWDEIYECTRKIYSEHNLNKRLALRKERVKTFYAYLSEFFNCLVSESQRRGLPADWCVNPFEYLSSRFTKDLERATRSALRLNPDGLLGEGLNERECLGEIIKIGPKNSYAFVSLNDEKDDGFISGVTLSRMPEKLLQKGLAVRCRIIDGERGPEVIYLESQNAKS